jgi:Ser/Thr protein kinase RdoA (MazF antagonist)
MVNQFQLSGVVLVAFGVYSYTRPMAVRSWVSGRTWDESPEYAKERQETSAEVVGVILAGLGLFLLALGTVMG